MPPRAKPSSAAAQAPPPLIVGSRAPDFSLPCAAWPEFEVRHVSLADYRDRWLILMFYPRDFSMVCPTELTALSAQIEEFHQRDCDVLGISTDSLETHKRWIVTPRSQGGLGGLTYPLAADEDAAVCQAYGVLLLRQHVALRGLFIIDPNGVLQYQVVHNLSVGRRSEEVLRVLDGLQTGGMCPEGWNRDEPPLDPTRVLGKDRVVGQYRIEQELGSGTFGVVYQARDLVLERTVALKVFRPVAAGASRKFLDEARAAAALNHPNVCTIYAVDESDGISIIVMEYVAGTTLQSRLADSRLPLDEAQHVARQIALGMTAAHDSGIVHGDLKPGNVMLNADGAAKIMDFGLARRQVVSASPQDVTLSWKADSQQGLSGTPLYMSPEQARSEPATTASDVFSLGLMLYELIAGQKAIQGDNLLDVLQQIDTLDGERFAQGMPEPLATIFRRALVADAPRRDITMRDIAELLERPAQALAS